MATAENVWAWSTTAGSNDAADASINWVEGQDPATVNNSARSMMAATKKWANVNSGNVTVGGSADAITITTGQTVSSGHQALGFRFCFKASATNTGATTVAVDGLSAVAIQRPNGDALSAGDIVSGGFFDIAFDGTNYKLLAAVGAAGTYGVLAGSNTWSGTNVFLDGATIGNNIADVVVIKSTTVNSAMSALLSSSSVAALRTAIGLGTAATQDIGTSGATVPHLNAFNTWSNVQQITRNTGNPGDSCLYLQRADASLPNYTLALFGYSGGFSGSITTASPNGSAVAYNTTSDARLKRDRRPIDDSGPAIDQLAPIRFRWSEGGAEDFGFDAQELYQVVPQAVTPGKGNPGDKDFIPWMMQHGRLEAILVAEIKALRARVAALEAAA